MQQFEDKSDEELVALSIQSPDNYLYLMRRYERKLMRYVRNISGLFYEDAQDLLQEIFLKTYRNLNGFDQDLKFSAWIYRIAHNEVISHYRKARARPKTVSAEDNNDLVKNLASDMNVLREIDRNLLKESVEKILEVMEEKYREVLILRYMESKNYNEISDILKKPIGSVAVLLNRAKKKFAHEAVKRGINLNF